MAKTNKQLSHNRHIILYAVVITLFLVIPVSADNQILNPSFEDGFDYWTPKNAATEINTTYYYHGSKSVRFEHSGGTSLMGQTLQVVDLTNVDKVSVYYTILKGDLAVFRVGIYSPTGCYIFNWESAGETDWTLVEIDVSGCSGNHDIRLDMQHYYNEPQGQTIGHWDFAYTDDAPPPPDCTINYNPDVPITNTKPFDLTYTLNDTFEGYWARIYGWHCSEMNNETYCLAHELESVTWVDDDIKYMTTDNYFHNYCWWDINDSYGIALYNIMGRTIHIPFTEIENDPNALAWDQIYVNYSWNATPPPDPTPQSTPDLTPSPTPTGTPTPQPTATPQPDPEPINQTLNTTFVHGYTDLVNNTMDGFFIPMYNFSDYIAQPLTSLNHTLSNFTVGMNNSFNTTTVNLGLSTNILFIIMLGFPQKIINLIGYYLTWVIILMIFKGET